jgi:hypothetical protein
MGTFAALVRREANVVFIIVDKGQPFEARPAYWAPFVRLDEHDHSAGGYAGLMGGLGRNLARCLAPWR